MKAVAGSILAVVVFLAVMMGLGWLAQGNQFFMYKFFAPKQEQVRREVFEQSKAYRQGMVQELQNMQLEYVKADKDGKAAMRSIILHRSADVPPDAMPVSLNAFIADLRNQSQASAF